MNLFLAALALVAFSAPLTMPAQNQWFDAKIEYPPGNTVYRGKCGWINTAVVLLPNGALETHFTYTEEPSNVTHYLVIPPGDIVQATIVGQ